MIKICEYCGKEYKSPPSRKSKCCSRKCDGLRRRKQGNRAIYVNRKGESLMYPYEWTSSLKESIRERDCHICQICGAEEGGRLHDVHHIDNDKANLDSQNLITLCAKCHGKTKGNFEYWKAFLSAKNRGETVELLRAISEKTGIPYPSLRFWAKNGLIDAVKSGSTWLTTIEAVKEAYDAHRIAPRCIPNFEEQKSNPIP